MASCVPTSTLLTILACAGLFFHLVLGLSCPDTESPVLDDKVKGSEVVVQGQVRRQVKANPGDTSYTAEVEVQCIFKGGPLTSVINVTGAGRQEGRCVQTDLSEGRVYLIYLNHVGDDAKSYTPTFTQDPADRKYLEELKYSCDLKVELPKGITDSDVCHPEKFVTDYQLDECEDAGSGSPAIPSPAFTVSCVACLILWIL